MQTPQNQRNSGQRQNQQQQQQQQPRNNNQTPQGNKGHQNYMRGRVNHVTAETTQEAPNVVIDTFLVNSKPASVFVTPG